MLAAIGLGRPHRQHSAGGTIARAANPIPFLFRGDAASSRGTGPAVPFEDSVRASRRPAPPVPLAVGLTSSLPPEALRRPPGPGRYPRFLPIPRARDRTVQSASERKPVHDPHRCPIEDQDRRDRPFDEGPFCVIGERIKSDGSQEACRRTRGGRLLYGGAGCAWEQVRSDGATMLDVNAGVVYNSNPDPNETEPPLMRRIIHLLQGLVDAPPM